jgi:hypothetical protein
MGSISSSPPGTIPRPGCPEVEASGEVVGGPPRAAVDGFPLDEGGVARFGVSWVGARPWVQSLSRMAVVSPGR